MQENTLTLLELNLLVRQVIETTMRHEYWVEAELAECRESRGHCYMELVQKEPDTNTPVARAQAKCWRSAWAMVEPHFVRVTGEQLRAGMKVRLKVYAQFHEAFGFSWIVTDIDPNFTLGDMARKRQEIIRQLRQEGIFDLQRELELPLFCQHVAVISSATAAGYGDFCRQLDDNGHGLWFHTELFDAVMQGEQVEQSLVEALNRIYERIEEFDCVVIIRGGGATADMSGFDTLLLAENVAQFPLPIITGIGHDRDESILDMVSHQRVKTPTAAAQLLIDHLYAVLRRTELAEEAIAYAARAKMEAERQRLQRLNTQIANLFRLVSTRQEARLVTLQQRLSTAPARHIDRCRHQLQLTATRIAATLPLRMEREQHRLQLIEKRLEALDPALLLQRGYSITLHNGRALHHAADVKAGDTIETIVADGRLSSVVGQQVSPTE